MPNRGGGGEVPNKILQKRSLWGTTVNEGSLVKRKGKTKRRKKVGKEGDLGGYLNAKRAVLFV